jgi:capsular polysaccharide biosynthesis protein
MPQAVSVPRLGHDSGTELHDVGRRVVGHYWWLIILLVILGAAAGAVSRSGEPTYTASARIVLDAPDPSTRAESTAIADTVKAIATSPAQVRAALRAAHITGRDPTEVASQHVSVTGLGSSALAKVSVGDKDRHVATDLANALAARVISIRTEVTTGGVPQELATLSKRIEGLSADIARTDATIDALNLKVANAASATSANDLRARRDTVSRRRDFLGQQRSVLESERVNILGAFALRPKPSIISRASVPLHADSSGRLPYMILGGLLGLILGVGLAALAETISPTVVGGDALARELDVPLLGTLRAGLYEADGRQDLTAVAVRVQLAAATAGVDDVGLLAATPGADLRGFANRLRATRAAEAGGARGGIRESIPNRASAVQIRPFSLASPLSLDERGATGLVLVSPRVLKKAAVAEIDNLLRVTAMPLLGLITYGSARLPKRAIVEREAEVVA